MKNAEKLYAVIGKGEGDGIVAAEVNGRIMPLVFSEEKVFRSALPYIKGQIKESANRLEIVEYEAVKRTRF